MKCITDNEPPLIELRSVIENRTVYTMKHCELNIFETFAPHQTIVFTSSDPVISNLICGKKIIHIDDKPPFEYLPGETLVIPPHVKLNINVPEASEEKPCRCMVIYIDHRQIAETINYLNEHCPKLEDHGVWSINFDHYHFNNGKELTSIITSLAKVVSSNAYHAKEALVDLLIKELLIHVMQIQNLSRVEKNMPYLATSNRFAHLLKHIHDNLISNLNIEGLCSEVCMSKASFFRAFKLEFGISPVEYIVKERIRMAKIYMADPLTSIKEACYRSGFNNIHYFVRTFKRVEGITPKMYRALVNPDKSSIIAQFNDNIVQ